MMKRRMASLKRKHAALRIHNLQSQKALANRLSIAYRTVEKPEIAQRDAEAHYPRQRPHSHQGIEERGPNNRPNNPK